MSLPSKMKALVTVEDHQATVQEVDVPTLDADEILVRTLAVTINPTDWKHVAFISGPGNRVGCDFVGVVEQLGSSVRNSSLQKGDRVAGFVHGGKEPERGSFAEYLKTDSKIVAKIPDNVDDLTAAALGIGGETAVQALFHRLNLPVPDFSNGAVPVKDDAQEVLIWSGSTTVGQWAIQLAHLAGYKVITTASPKNHDLLKSLGADDLFDYRDESTPEKISSKYPKLSKALDCISENGTQQLCVKSLGQGGGEVVVLLKPDKEAIELRKGEVKIIHTLAYTALGRPFNYGKAVYDQATVEADSKKMQEWLNGDKGHFYTLFKQGLLKGNRTKEMQGGLEGINEGMKYLQEGKASAEKLTYRISS
ncbi:Alcohol dehydrogenase, C-terminal [Kalmanozyma brasiliensis GHG001]|uniref:Enoyl reductase (ER) domain-containing protein n=1 Tax=Kalmanozyma brasiliensis (strain GHG001) TaxID=1365824 RepID=V5EKX2_KALBG|nr:Alcohol dehydrogenase, C-terminal [Kalmanozyma brasiliensis GHG001]EST05610.1 Alcohol dehydrogenase, C-terminal [Kalmanozyma brasiliensis GHG001]